MPNDSKSVINRPGYYTFWVGLEDFLYTRLSGPRKVCETIEDYEVELIL